MVCPISRSSILFPNIMFFCQMPWPMPVKRRFFPELFIYLRQWTIVSQLIKQPTKLITYNVFSWY